MGAKNSVTVRFNKNKMSNVSDIIIRKRKNQCSTGNFPEDTFGQIPVGDGSWK